MSFFTISSSRNKVDLSTRSFPPKKSEQNIPSTWRILAHVLQLAPPPTQPEIWWACTNLLNASFKIHSANAHAFLRTLRPFQLPLPSLLSSFHLYFLSPLSFTVPSPIPFPSSPHPFTSSFPSPHILPSLFPSSLYLSLLVSTLPFLPPSSSPLPYPPLHYAHHPPCRPSLPASSLATPAIYEPRGAPGCTIIRGFCLTLRPACPHARPGLLPRAPAPQPLALARTRKRVCKTDDLQRRPEECILI